MATHIEAIHYLEPFETRLAVVRYKKVQDVAGVTREVLRSWHISERTKAEEYLAYVESESQRDKEALERCKAEANN